MVHDADRIRKILESDPETVEELLELMPRASLSCPFTTRAIRLLRYNDDVTIKGALILALIEVMKDRNRLRDDIYNQTLNMSRPITIITGRKE